MGQPQTAEDYNTATLYHGPRSIVGRLLRAQNSITSKLLGSLVPDSGKIELPGKGVKGEVL